AIGSSSTSRARRKGSRQRRWSGRSSTQSLRRRSTSEPSRPSRATNGGDDPSPGTVPTAAATSNRPVFLPGELDATVFDEAFLRQLERLLLLMRSPVRGGLKGGRRSVKRGQSVEFAD